MDYCWLGWILVLIGTLLFVIGGLVATYGWDIWSRKTERGKNLRKCMWTILGGTFAIASGGLLTTYGWNVISLGEQRNNLIRAVAQELCMDVNSLESPPIKGETYFIKNDGDVGIRPYPNLGITALDAVISSGLWNFGNQTERHFLCAIFDYEERLKIVNSKFYWYNESLDHTWDPNRAIALAEAYQKNLPKKDSFKSLKIQQNEVIKLLLTEYKWAIPPTEANELRIAVAKFEKPLVDKPTEDVNKPQETLPKN